ncbi:MAG: hypothetical protein ACKPE2_04175, partial [Dolichospermum sp.]
MIIDIFPSACFSSPWRTVRIFFQVSPYSKTVNSPQQATPNESACPEIYWIRVTRLAAPSANPIATQKPAGPLMEESAQTKVESKSCPTCHAPDFSTKSSLES